MDYKEKLRLAKEALESGSYDKDTIEYIFPELKKSEDEDNKRISKEISRFLKQNNGWNNEWLTWLEKQGKQKSIWYNEDEEPKRGSLILLIMQNKTPIVAKIIDPNHTFNHGERWAYIDDLLEKQGEQKSINDTDDDIVEAVKDASILDMVKPKLKIESGKWYVCIRNLLDDYGNRAFCKGDVYLSEKDEYLIPCNSNVPWYLPYCVDTYFRNWTIQDAKNGDVLNDGTTIFIFKDLLSDGSVLTYCDYNTDSGVSDAFYPLSMDLMCSKITPATKEQRALFFQKMKEAGYEWDAEKKELKIIDFSKHLKCNPDAPSIIEQKPA